MSIKTTDKFYVMIIIIACVAGFFMILLNNFYDLVIFVLFIAMALTVFSMNMGTYLARLAPPMFINLRMSDKDKFGIFGRYNHHYTQVKNKFILIADIENYIVKHSGHEGLIKSLSNLIRGDTPMSFEFTEGELFELPKTMTKNPEGYMFLIDDTFRKWLGIETERKMDQLEDRDKITMMYVANLKKLIKSLQKTASQTNRETIEEAGKIIDDLQSNANMPMMVPMMGSTPALQTNGDEE